MAALTSGARVALVQTVGAYHGLELM